MDGTNVPFGAGGRGARLSRATRVLQQRPFQQSNSMESGEGEGRGDRGSAKRSASRASPLGNHGASCCGASGAGSFGQGGSQMLSRLSLSLSLFFLSFFFGSSRGEALFTPGQRGASSKEREPRRGLLPVTSPPRFRHSAHAALTRMLLVGLMPCLAKHRCGEHTWTRCCSCPCCRRNRSAGRQSRKKKEIPTFAVTFLFLARLASCRASPGARLSPPRASAALSSLPACGIPGGVQRKRQHWQREHKARLTPSSPQRRRWRRRQRQPPPAAPTSQLLSVLRTLPSSDF
ncbi:uncharacterized protein LOC131189594 [Ahaetulla prasina]|uniref:uncharacterized protein LOC131189594 n=1 Tax=Ahaetulla prasina TaxID=499056 RepID=UPI002648D09E|nr:uncharacterized protein LOC131189594 [Ahaetulla prasina]XP_058021767.1 uncharacterized protein LOC131189594 [Ahaetulla prasina]